ncbi:MAG: HEAT repeat domain-containing protein [Planctomycetes bacterium]|nr:HEAT repeat domain-containing protein [Planctomycetota bacterium]
MHGTTWKWLSVSIVAWCAAVGAAVAQERSEEPPTIDGVSLEDWADRIIQAKPEEQSALLDRLLPLVKSGPSLARAEAAALLSSFASELERHGPRFELAIVTLLELAGGDDLPAARTAMQALSFSARVEPRVVDAAVARLTSSDVELRRAATWALASALPSDSRCEQWLRERLADRDAQVRCAAVTALIAEGAKDDVVAGVFVELAGCDDAYARSSVLAHFGWLGNDFLSAQLPLLLEKLRSDSSTDRGNAALWIGTLGEAGYDVPDAVPPLLELARDSNRGAREAAARALGVVGATTEQAVPALAALLADASSEVRYSALASLAQAGEEVVLALPELIAALDHVDAQQRAAVANLIALGGAQSAAAVEALQRRLADPVANVRTWSAFALRSIGAASLPALPLFERMVRGEPDAKARLEAVRAIAALGSLAGGVAEPVAAACRDPDRDVQLWSLFALGELGVVTEATRAALQTALASGDAALIEEAAKAAAKLGLGEEAGGAAKDAAATAAAGAGGTPQPRSAPRSAPVVYEKLALVLVDARGAAIVDFEAPYTTVDDGIERCGITVRWRYLARGQSKATEGSDDAFERRWVSGNSTNTKSDLAPGQVDSSAAWLDAGPLRLQWSNRGNDTGWIYWRRDELRVELASEGDFETLDLSRWLHDSPLAAPPDRR